MKWNVGRVEKVNEGNGLFHIIILHKINIIYSIYRESNSEAEEGETECTMLHISMHAVNCVIKSETARRHEKTNNRRENNVRKKMSFMHIHFSKICSLLMSSSRINLGADQTTDPQISGRPALPLSHRRHCFLVKGLKRTFAGLINGSHFLFLGLSTSISADETRDCSVITAGWWAAGWSEYSADSELSAHSSIFKKGIKNFRAEISSFNSMPKKLVPKLPIMQLDCLAWSHTSFFLCIFFLKMQ